MHFLHQHGQHEATSATIRRAGRDTFALVGFSLGGGYSLDMSVTLAEEIAAVVIFYDSYPGLDYGQAQAAYLCHFAEHDPYHAAEAAGQMEQTLQAAGRLATIYTYPGTTHWFFEANRPDAFDAAAALAWERTLAFLNTELRRPEESSSDAGW